jgi:ClpP class serine protease
MGSSEILWVLLTALALQPVIKQRLLVASRQRLIDRIERMRGSRVIVLVHRQETMSLLGFPVLRYIDIDDAEAVLRAIRMTDPRTPIDLVLHTPGGLLLAASQIARALRRHEGKVTVMVPHYAMSGGTLIALAADEILMAEHAVLGPVDPQLGSYPAPAILRTLRKKPLHEVSDEMLLLADQAERAVEQVRRTVLELTQGRCSASDCDRLATSLSEGVFTHDFPITADMAKGLGLPVRTDLPAEVFDLLALYPQPLRRQPTVEYVPWQGDRRRSPGG